jgi:hypothetical protein
MATTDISWSPPAVGMVHNTDERMKLMLRLYVLRRFFGTCRRSEEVVRAVPAHSFEEALALLGMEFDPFHRSYHSGERLETIAGVARIPKTEKRFVLEEFRERCGAAERAASRSR